VIAIGWPESLENASDGPFKKKDDRASDMPLERSEQLSSFNAFKRRLTPAIADSYNNLGVILADGGNLDDALVALNMLWHGIPTWRALTATGVWPPFRNRHYVDAVFPLRRLLRSHPADIKVRSELATSLLRLVSFARS